MKISRKISIVLLAVVMLIAIIPGVWTDVVPSTSAEAYSSLRNGSLSEKTTAYKSDGTAVSVPAYWNASPVGLSWVMNSLQNNEYMWEVNGDAANGTVLLSQVIQVDCNATYAFKFWNYKRNTVSCDQANFRYKIELGKTEDSFETTVLEGAPRKATYGTGVGEQDLSFSAGSYKYARISFIAATGYPACLTDITVSTQKSGDTNTHATPVLKHTHEGKSRTEGHYDSEGILHPESNGLAFKFELASSGITVNTTAEYYSQGRYDIDYTGGNVQPFSNTSTYALVKTGAVITNDATVGNDLAAFTLGNTNGSSVIDVPARKAWDIPGANLEFVVRIIHIPDTHTDTVIYCRPYYVFVDSSGSQITVYSDIYSDSFNGLPVE